MNTGRVLPAEPPRYKKGAVPKEEILSIDIDHEEAFRMLGGKEQISKWEEKNCLRKIKQEHQPELQQNLVCKTSLVKLDYFIILLPILSSGFSYGPQVYEVLISGNKGVVEGKRPFGTGLIGKTCMDAFNKVSTIVGESI
jgi:hypothetical protein